MSKDGLWAALLGLLLLPLLLVPFIPAPQSGGPLTLPPGEPSLPYRSYTVRPGDTFVSIAERYGIPLPYLLASNPSTRPATLRSGQELILPDGGVVHTVRQGQSLSDLARAYSVEVTALRWDGAGGPPRAGDHVFVPRPSTVPRSTALNLGADHGTRFIWPLRGRISSPYGWRLHPILGERHLHIGLDIAVPEGTPVHAAAGGRVVEAGWSGGYGILVVVDHDDDYSTYYAHLSALRVSLGQYVEQGQLLALSGNTGMSTGPHLHFEIRAGGQPVDPEIYLP